MATAAASVLGTETRVSENLVTMQQGSAYDPDTLRVRMRRELGDLQQTEQPIRICSSCKENENAHDAMYTEQQTHPIPSSESPGASKMEARVVNLHKGIVY